MTGISIHGVEALGSQQESLCSYMISVNALHQTGCARGYIREVPQTVKLR